MKSRKQQLIDSLNRAIYSLKNNIVTYRWEKQGQCNCGIVLQAVLGEDRFQIQNRFREESKLLSLLPNNSQFQSSDRTWRNIVKNTCSATGIPTDGILKMLYDKGLSPEDIVHLEYMSNNTILEKANISKTNIQEYVFVEEDIREIKIDTFFGKLFGLKKIEKSEAKWEWQSVEYYRSKENLIKYITAWKEILKEDLSKEQDNKNTWNKQLLQAVADEDYEFAVVLRDKINS